MEVSGRLSIASEALAALRRHVEAAERGCEVGGRLLIRNGAAFEFQPAANLSDRPGTYLRGPLPSLPPGCDDLRVHSHPNGALHPSRQDIENARHRGDLVFGVATRAGLAVWEVVGEDVRRVPCRVVWLSSRRPLRRPGRRA